MKIDFITVARHTSHTVLHWSLDGIFYMPGNALKSINNKLSTIAPNFDYWCILEDVQLNECKTNGYFLEFFQIHTTVCLNIYVFCKICEPEIVLKDKNNYYRQKNQFHVCNSYKKCKSTSAWIGNFEGSCSSASYSFSCTNNHKNYHLKSNTT